MKKIILILLSLLLISQAYCQDKEAKQPEESLALHANPEAYDFFNKNGSYSANVSAYSFLPLKKHFALSMYTLIEEDRDSLTSGGEALIGPTYLSPCLEAGFLVGIEVAKKLYRYSPWILIRSKNEKFVFLGVYEKGASGEGIRVESWYTVKKTGDWQLKLGAIAHKPHYGPAIKVAYKKAYIFSDPFMWSWDKKEPSVSLIGIGAEL